jgi:tetratricopeptide (TPR) repeat protein
MVSNDTKTVVTDTGGAGAGVVSTPPSASAGVENTSASTQASPKRLSMVLSPFIKDRPNVLIVRHNALLEVSPFAQLYATDPREALRLCDERLKEIGETDYARSLKWSSRMAMAQRALLDTKGAMRTHLLSNPLASLVTDNPLVLGNHVHGLAFTRMELGEFDEAREGFIRAKELFVAAECEKYAATADNNLGLTLIRQGRAGEALVHVSRAILSAEKLEDFGLAEEFADTLKQAYASLSISSAERAAVPQRG